MCIRDRQTTNMFTRVVENVSSTVTMSTTKNISSSSSYGMEVTAIYYVTNWWFLNANSSVFNYKINSDSVTKDKVVYHFKVISNMSIPKIINIQLSGNYRSGMITTCLLYTSIPLFACLNDLHMWMRCCARFRLRPLPAAVRSRAASATRSRPNHFGQTLSLPA